MEGMAALRMTAAGGGGDEEREQGQTVEKEESASSSPQGPEHLPLANYLYANAPDDLICPITRRLLVESVVLAGDGVTYSRAAIEERLALHRKRAWALNVELMGNVDRSRTAY